MIVNKDLGSTLRIAIKSSPYSVKEVAGMIGRSRFTVMLAANQGIISETVFLRLRQYFPVIQQYSTLFDITQHRE